MRILTFWEAQQATTRSVGSVAAYLAVFFPSVIIGAIVFPSRWAGVIVTAGIVIHHLRLSWVADRAKRRGAHRR